MEADLHDSFETVAVLVSTLGLPLFLSARSTEDHLKDRSIFLVKNRDSAASGMLTDEGFVIFSGAKLVKELSPTLQKKSPRFRSKYINDKNTEDKGSYYLLLEDVVCNSPSTAASLITGHGMNGWQVWKHKDGRTLSHVYRQVQTN